MLYYYHNPINGDLIVMDTEKNELVIIERINKVEIFTEHEMFNSVKPLKEKEEESISGEEGTEGETEKKVRKKGRKSTITPETRERIKEMVADGISTSEIAKEFGISKASVYKQKSL